MHFLFLFGLLLIGVVNGFINVTGGGGGLITTPLLLALGLSPYAALATSKFVPIGGLVSGGAKYYKEKVVRRNKSLLYLAIIVSIGGFIAANLTLSINATILKYIIITATSVMLLLAIFAKDRPVSQVSKDTVSHSPSFGLLFWSFIVSIYQGSIGIGGGIFLAAIFRKFMQYSYLASAALMSVLTILIALISAATFTLKGVVNFEYGIPLFLGSIIGGYVGAHTAIKKGDRLLKLITIVVSIALLLKVILT
jgi:uncharacterized membrane protein YfcA